VTEAGVGVTATELLEEIKQDAWRQRHVWNTARFLFAGDKNNVDVMNAVAGEFFGMMQRLMFTDAVLRVCRLTDPPKNRHQENVTLARLLEATGWEQSDTARWATFSDKLKAVKQACSGCRKQRDKIIAHKDLDVWAKTTSLTLPTLRMIDDAIQAIEAFVNEISIALGKGEVGFDHIIHGDRPAKTLMRSLTNRASQKTKNAATISYTAGERMAEFECAYCGLKEAIRFYPDGEPSPKKLARRHYDACHGVIGCEEIIVELIERESRELAQQIEINLQVPTTQT
jgi:hypothetical protein